MCLVREHCFSTHSSGRPQALRKSHTLASTYDLGCTSVQGGPPAHILSYSQYPLPTGTTKAFLSCVWPRKSAPLFSSTFPLDCSCQQRTRTTVQTTIHCNFPHWTDSNHDSATALAGRRALLDGLFTNSQTSDTLLGGQICGSAQRAGSSCTAAWQKD